MPLTLQKGLALVPQAITLILDSETGIAALPPAASRKAIDYAKLIGCPPGSLGYELASAIDAVEAAAATP
jgi:hypothetical protein